MKQFEVLYTDKRVEIVDEETVEQLIDELELFDRWDVSQIHRLTKTGKLGDTIWTEEEGILRRL